jgi:GNAT superfamily N-acetyltransferase
MADIWLTSFKATYPFPPAHTDAEVHIWVSESLLRETEAWVVRDSDTPIGFIALGDRSVEQLYLLPGSTGRGIGSRLIGLAQARSPDGLELWTFQVNVGARRFYERHGFRAVELTDGSANEEHEPDVRYVWP